jgi:hypothetical protein
MQENSDIRLQRIRKNLAKIRSKVLSGDLKLSKKVVLRIIDLRVHESV